MKGQFPEQRYMLEQRVERLETIVRGFVQALPGIEIDEAMFERRYIPWAVVQPPIEFEEVETTEKVPTGGFLDCRDNEGESLDPREPYYDSEGEEHW